MAYECPLSAESRRRRYLGEIVAEFDSAPGHVVWQCPVCGDNGLIHGWEHTLWNRHGGAHASSTDTAPTTKH